MILKNQLIIGCGPARFGEVTNDILDSVYKELSDYVIDGTNLGVDDDIESNTVNLNHVNFTYNNVLKYKNAIFADIEILNTFRGLILERSIKILGKRSIIFRPRINFRYGGSEGSFQLLSIHTCYLYSKHYFEDWLLNTDKWKSKNLYQKKKLEY